MSQPIMKTIDQQVTGIVSEANIDEWSHQYWVQGNFFALEHLMSQSLIEELLREVDGVRLKLIAILFPGIKRVVA